MKIHALASLFPAMSAAEYAELKADIALQGVRVPVLVHEGEIVDGRHRWQACEELGIECPVQTWGVDVLGSSLVQHVVALNLKRRSLSASQRAMIAREMLPMLESEASTRSGDNLKRGQYSSKISRERQKTLSGKSSEIAAKSVGVSSKQVERAKAVATRSPDLIDDVKSGKLTLTKAAKVVEQREAEKAPERPAILDGLGRPVVHASAVEAIQQAQRFGELNRRVHALKREIEAIAAEPVGREIRLQAIVTDLKNVATAIKFATPFTTCPYDSNCNRGCKTCGGMKWITERQYNALPKELM